MVMVAKVYYSEGDFAKAETYLNHASKIKVQNEELYGLKRQIKNQESDRIKKILNQAEYEMNKKQFDKALETLKSAYQLSGSSDSNLEKQIEELEKQISINKYLVEINDLIKKNDYENAAIKVDEALQTFPNNEELNEKSTQINKVLEEIQEKLDEEEREKNRAEELKRKNEMAAFSLKKDASKFESEKDYDNAIASLKKALKYTPNDNQISKKIEELQETSKKERERNTYYSKVNEELKTLISTQNYEECALKAKDLLKDYPEYKETLALTITECYLKLQNYEEASKAADNLKDDKNNQDVYNFAKGIYQYNFGDSAEAKKYLELVKNSNNSKYQSEASSILSWIFIKKIQIGIYIFLVIIVIVVAPKVKDYLKQKNAYNMAKKLERIKETGNYEANYDFLKQRYEKEDVDNMKLVQLLYAAALQKKGEFEQSYQLINEYIKKDSRSPLAKSIAGETAMAIGETSPLGLEQIQGLLKLNENRKDVVEYLAKAYISLKADHKLAQEYISKYISFNPNDSAAITYLADVYISRLNYNAQTIKTFEKAVKANPDKVEYYVALKDNYQNIGNQEEADKMQAIIEEKFPDYSSAPSKQQEAAYDPYAFPQDYGQQQFSNTLNNDISQDQSYAQSAQGANTDNSYEQQILQQQMLFQQASNKSNAFPDYDNIGGAQLPGLDAPLDYNNLNNQNASQNFGQDPSSNGLQKQPAPIIQGPKKNCPHCGAVNPAGEYYCNSCGKPF